MTYSASKGSNNALQENRICPLNAFLDNMVSVVILHTVHNMALQLGDELSLFHNKFCDTILNSHVHNRTSWLECMFQTYLKFRRKGLNRLLDHPTPVHLQREVEDVSL